MILLQSRAIILHTEFQTVGDETMPFQMADYYLLEQITDPRKKRNLAAVTSILAGLELDEQTIRQLMRNPVMRESTMYQSILREGEAIGLERGLTQGRIVGETELVIKLLTRKVGSLSPKPIARVL